MQTMEVVVVGPAEDMPSCQQAWRAWDRERLSEGALPIG